MTRTLKIVLTIAGVAFAATAASAAYAQVTSGDQSTPSGFNWEIKDGKRVPKGQRKVNADGSWREETKVGNCTTVKEGTAAGEVKITRTCD